jgi:hypothetical protein
MKTKVDRKELVATAKDMNTSLGLKPAILFKDDKGEKRPTEDIADDVLKYALGYNDETKQYIKKEAVREGELQDTSWAVIQKLIAESKQKSGKTEDKGESKSEAKKPEAKKSKADFSIVDKMTKEGALAKVATPKVGGKLPTDMKTLTNVLQNQGKNVSLARRYCAQLLNKATLAEHIEASEKIQKEMGITRGIIPHIKWCKEMYGWVFKDTRKYQHDKTGTVYLVSVDPSLAGKFKETLPIRPAKEAKKEVPAKKTVKAEASAKKPAKNAEPEKTDKKAKKSAEPEKAKAKSSEKKAKK